MNEFDYQLDRHCSKTHGEGQKNRHEFDYQLDRHCSKTRRLLAHRLRGLITS